jgi:hypothetical protein
MTIPDRPLELDSETVKINLGDLDIFDQELADTAPVEYVLGVRRFLLRHSTSWTRAEIREIDVGELKDLGPQIAEATRRQAVPLASSAGSRTGRAGKATGHRGGAPSSSSRPSSASRRTKLESG